MNTALLLCLFCESFVVGLLPNGSMTNMTRSLSIPSMSEMTFRVYGFGTVTNSNSKDIYPVLPGNLRINYTYSGFSVFDSGFRATGMPALVGPALVNVSFQASDLPEREQLNPNSGLLVIASLAPVVYPPHKSIVIPAGSSGAEIALESSYDLIRWEPAALGRYSAPTNNLFFRLKLHGLQTP